MIYDDLELFKASFKNDCGRIMAFDLGTKRIGIAICDDLWKITTPKQIYIRQNQQQDFKWLSNLINENRAIALVIGFPTNLNGSKTTMTDVVNDFANKFAEFWQKNKFPKLPIMLWDERLSSFEARSKLTEINNNKRKFYDDIAASIILEHFLSNLAS